MAGIDIKQTIEITDQMLDDALVSGAINYWGYIQLLMPKSDRGPYMLIQPSDDEGEDFDPVTISKHQLMEAFAKIFVSEKGYVADYFRQAVAQGELVDNVLQPDMGCIDDEAADMWLQEAAFGEQVYG